MSCASPLDPAPQAPCFVPLRSNFFVYAPEYDLILESWVYCRSTPGYAYVTCNCQPTVTPGFRAPTVHDGFDGYAYSE